MFTVKSVRVSIVCACLLLLIAGAWVGSASPVRAQEPNDGKIKELLKVRHATLQEIANLTEKAYRGGKADYEQVLQAKRAALTAELDLHDTGNERIAILEKIVALAKQQEERAAMLLKAAQVARSDMLKSTVSRLEAEIALERARAKVSAKPK